MDVFDLGDQLVKELLALKTSDEIEEWASSPIQNPSTSTPENNHIKKQVFLPQNSSSKILPPRGITPAWLPPPCDGFFEEVKLSEPGEGQNFHGGCLLKNIGMWSQMLADLEQQGIEVKDFLKRAVKNEAFDLLDAEFFDSKRKNLKFRGKYFSNFEAFRGESFDNYKGCDDFEELLAADLKKFQLAGVVKEVKKEECFVISPLNYIYDEDACKGRLIFHFALNGFYSKPNLYLESPLDYLYELRRANWMEKFDLKKAYFQFLVLVSNRKYLSFSFKGRFYQFLVLPMGCSQSAYIVQNTNKTSGRYFTLKTGQFNNVFLDDFLVIPSEKDNAPKLDNFLRKMGYIFSEEKRESGAELEYCGYLISAV